MRCKFCGKLVDPDDPSLYYETTFWVTSADQNALAVNRRTGAVGCSTCIEVESGSHHPGQPTLFDLDEDEKVNMREWYRGDAAGWRGDELLLPLESHHKDFIAGYESGQFRKSIYMGSGKSQ